MADNDTPSTDLTPGLERAKIIASTRFSHFASEQAFVQFLAAIDDAIERG